MISKFESVKAILVGLSQKLRGIKQSFQVVHDTNLSGNGLNGIKIESGSENSKFSSFKEFLGTNKGIALIAVILFCVFGAINFSHKKHSETSTDSVVGWNSPIISSSPSIQTQPTPLSENQNLQNQINLIKQDISSIQSELKPFTQNTVRQPYQLLGVRFDDETNQWVVDIKIENSIKSFKSGENFAGWKVINVDSQGALIQ
jgi:hypothetical protein